MRSVGKVSLGYAQVVDELDLENDVGRTLMYPRPVWLWQNDPPCE